MSYHVSQSKVRVEIDRRTVWVKDQLSNLLTTEICVDSAGYFVALLDMHIEPDEAADILAIPRKLREWRSRIDESRQRVAVPAMY